MGDVIPILIKTTTNITNSSITAAAGIVEKKTINMVTRRTNVNQLADSLQEGKSTREILK